MSGRLSALDIEAMLEDGTLEDLRRSDLERMDYDPPKERVALVCWRAEHVDSYGERIAGHWSIEMAGDHKRWRELHTWGVLLFGDPPWCRSQVISVVGRLGSIEAAVKAMAPPSPEFSYVFDVDVDVKSSGLAAEERRLPRGGGYATRERRFQRAQSAAAGDLARAERKARAKLAPRQGELF